MNEEKVCPACEKQEGEVNHPRGMVFVGWGLGWQACPHCGGSGFESSEDEDNCEDP